MYRICPKCGFEQTARGALAALALAAAPADAQRHFWSAADLVRECARESANCVAYLTGAYDAFRHAYTMGRIEGRVWQPYLPQRFCPPDGLHNRALPPLFMAYASKHADALAKPASALVFRAFREAWPCE